MQILPRSFFSTGKRGNFKYLQLRNQSLVESIFNQKASVEEILPDQGSSFAYKVYRSDAGCPAVLWHIHPEFELVYIKNGNGNCHVGKHFSRYEDGLLIFLGPNLPHFSFSNRESSPHIEVVLQIKEEMMMQIFGHAPEFAPIRQLFERSRQGLVFGDQVKHFIGEKLMALEQLPPLQRLLHLTTILEELSQTNCYSALEAGGPVFELKSNDRKKVDLVTEYVEKHYLEEIRLEDIASIIHMTVPAFCRFFKRVTQRTFITYLNEVRLSHACGLLLQRQTNISEVAYASGFGNVSHFHRLFKEAMGQTPRSYQEAFSFVMAGSS